MQRPLVFLVKAYRLLVSPALGSACRFEPTCSTYAITALQNHGSLRGSYLAACRIVRCQPWCQGGDDPVPLLFSWRIDAKQSTSPNAQEKHS